MKRCFAFVTAFVLAVMVFAVSAGAQDFGRISVNVPEGWLADTDDDGTVMLANPNDDGDEWIAIEVYSKNGHSLEDCARYECEDNGGTRLVEDDNGFWFFFIENAELDVYVDDNTTGTGIGIQDGDYIVIRVAAGVSTEDLNTVLGLGSGSGSRDDDSSGCNTGISAFAVLGAFLAFRKKNG